MRIRHAPILLLILAGSCRTSSAPISTDPPPEPSLTSLVAGFKSGSTEAEARLAAGGPDVAGAVRAGLRSEDPALRLRTLEVLLSAGEDIALSDREVAELALFEISRGDAQPWSGLRGFGRLRDLGSAALPALSAAAGGDGPSAEAARRLLREWKP